MQFVFTGSCDREVLYYRQTSSTASLGVFYTTRKASPAGNSCAMNHLPFSCCYTCTLLDICPEYKFRVESDNFLAFVICTAGSGGWCKLLVGGAFGLLYNFLFSKLWCCLLHRGFRYLHILRHFILSCRTRHAVVHAISVKNWIRSFILN